MGVAEIVLIVLLFITGAITLGTLVNTAYPRNMSSLLTALFLLAVTVFFWSLGLHLIVN
jgi:hypothetical protein